MYLATNPAKRPTRLSIDLASPDHRNRNDLPYLDKPLVPLTVALPQLLENYEEGLANREREDAEKQRLRQIACVALSLSLILPASDFGPHVVPR